MSHVSRQKFNRSGMPLNRRPKSPSEAELTRRLWAYLNAKIHGLSFSPVMTGQNNKSFIPEAQIRDRLDIIKDHTQWIRTFSCTDGNDRMPGIAKSLGMKTMVGVWLDDDLENNEEEMANALAVVKAGHADILAVGNEVLLRGEMSEDDLIAYINRAKAAAGDVPVGYVDAYFQFEDHPRVAAACDVILVNCYPFWEETPLDYALYHMKDMYARACKAAGGKKVIIAETGWPTKGEAFGGAVPSLQAALKYFVDTYDWATADGIDIFYFAAFDEDWKVGKEGDVGAYWGLWDKDGEPKYD